MLWIHVIAGLVALASGAVALYAVKGGDWHRRGGIGFTVAMLAMTGSAVIIAAYLRPNIGNVIAGSLTGYLVVTGWLAVKRSVAETRALLFGLMLVAFSAGFSALALGGVAAARPNGAIDGIPAPAFYMFATVGIGAGLLDLRLLIAGEIRGKQRLARHLWRMGYAMWIATLSFFLGQADEFPAVVSDSGALIVPVLLVTATLLYWIIRIQIARHPLRAPKRDTTRPGTAHTIAVTAEDPR